MVFLMIGIVSESLCCASSISELSICYSISLSEAWQALASTKYLVLLPVRSNAKAFHHHLPHTQATANMAHDTKSDLSASSAEKRLEVERLTPEEI